MPDGMTVERISLCPHCKRSTEGLALDKGLYILVICDDCDVILGVLPKFYQKCTWKLIRKEEDEEGEAPRAVEADGRRAAASSAGNRAVRTGRAAGNGSSSAQQRTSAR